LVDVLIRRPLVGCRENAKELTLSQEASGMILQNHRRLPVAFSVSKSQLLGLRSGLLEGFLKLLSNFIEAT